jgi:LacI family transcriptional regulator
MQGVAEVAGVSMGTVSNYLNRPDVLAEGTRARVHDAIEQLGYIRNSSARGLRRQQTDGIGLIVPDILGRLFVGIARGAQIAARQQELRLVMANAVYVFESFSPQITSDQQDDYLDYFAEARMSGILYAAMSDPTEGIARIRSHVRPIVVINYDQPGDWCSVLMDNQQAGRLAGSHLAAGGIRRIFYLSPADVAQPIADRRRGLHDIAVDLGIEITDVPTHDLTSHEGYRIARLIVDELRPEKPFAILGITDDLALGAMQFLRTRPELYIPEDVAVMGLDGNHDGGAHDWMTLTSIELPGHAMGEQAVRLVLDESRPDHRHERRILPVSIRQGESTPCPSPSRLTHAAGDSPSAAEQGLLRRAVHA